MKKDKILIGVDLGIAPTDYKCICVMKQHKDGIAEVIDSFSTLDSTLFKEKKKELETKYNIDPNQSLIKKSRKTKDTKSFKSSDYEMFKNGFFNCDNIPYGYNFLIRRCMEPVTFEPKRKEK